MDSTPTTLLRPGLTPGDMKKLAELREQHADRKTWMAEFDKRQEQRHANSNPAPPAPNDDTARASPLAAIPDLDPTEYDEKIVNAVKAMKETLQQQGASVDDLRAQMGAAAKETEDLRRAGKRAAGSVAGMMAYGLACGTAEGWTLAAVAALALVALAIWGAGGKSPAARRVRDTWPVVVVFVVIVAGGIVAPIAAATSLERVGMVVKLALCVAIIVSVVVAAGLASDWKCRPDRRGGWTAALAVILLTAAALAWSLVNGG